MNNEVNKGFISDAETVAEESKNIEINVLQILSVLLGKLWILILAGLVAAVAAYFYTDNFVTPTYRSTARVYILNRQNSLATSINDLNSAVSMKEDFRILIRSNEVYRQVLKTAGKDDEYIQKFYRSLGNKLSLDNNTSRFVDITITDKDPVEAKILADAFANVSRVIAKEIMGVEDVTVAEYGEIPTSPSSPDLQSNVIVAALAGIVISALIIVVLHVVNDSITSEEDLEKALGVCVLGSIPDVSTLRRKKQSAAKTHQNTVQK